MADYLSERLTKLNIKNGIIDLNEKRLPLYDGTDEGDWKTVWDEISATFNQSDGFVFVSPEWDGMFSVGLHNMFHYADKELADKPVLAVGVSSGRGGRYPLQQMRIMGYKNKRVVVMPESLFFDHIKESLVDGKLVDERMVERTDFMHSGSCLNTPKLYRQSAKAESLIIRSFLADYRVLT